MKNEEKTIKFIRGGEIFGHLSTYSETTAYQIAVNLAILNDTLTSIKDILTSNNTWNRHDYEGDNESEVENNEID